MSLIQQSALRSMQSLQASTSGRLNSVARISRQRSRGCENSGAPFCKLGSSVNSVSIWKLRQLSLNHERRGTSCSSSGGTRRDDGKIVARTQKRRSRHVKGVTPTTPELFDMLEAEKEADKELQSDIEVDTSDDLEKNFADGSEKEGEELLKKPALTAELSQAPNGKASGDSEPKEDTNTEQERSDQVSGTSSSSGVEEIVESGENTYTIKYFPEGKGGQTAATKTARNTGENVSSAIEDTVKDVSSAAEESIEVASENLSEAGDSVRENVEDVVEEVGEAVGEVSNVVEDTVTDVSSTVQDTADDITSTAQEAGEETAQSLSEAGAAVQETLEEGREQLGTAVAEVTDIVLDTAEDVAATAEETTQEVQEDLGEAGDAVLESIEEVRSEGQKAVEEAASALGERAEQRQKEAEENLSELGTQAQEASDRAGKALEKVSDEAEKSLQIIQESFTTLVEDSAKAAETIGSEAIGLGEVVVTAAGEAAGFQSTTKDSTKMNGKGSGQAVKEKPKTDTRNINEESKPSGTPRMEEIRGKKWKSSLPAESKEEDENMYKGLKVTVAGAAGRTGRLVVQELVRKGVPVRALVRNKNKREAQDLGKLSNVEVVQADLYKYETIRKSLGDSNVVISAIGARSFPFDPIGTYQGEFEGVKNLVAAAKNKGDVKKFVFVTTLGVTFLQIIPLIFWKKQSELYLQRSGLDYTIVRPGGLTNETNGREVISMKPADTQFGGTISRTKVAQVCVAALITPEASEKTVEIVSGGRGGRSFSDLFGSI